MTSNFSSDVYAVMYAYYIIIFPPTEKPVDALKGEYNDAHTVGVKINFPFTIRLSTVYRLNGNSFSCVFSVHTTDKLNMCSVISTS